MANYWQDRFVQLEKAQMNKGIEYYHELEKQYSKAAEEVQKEIMKWYGRLAKNNEISVSDARKLLTKDELQEFKWSVETYIQKGRENDIDGRWMKELENASAKVHINRLEAMKLQMQQQVEMLYGNEIDSFDKHIRDTYTEGFYRTAYEIQKGLGVGTNLAKLDTEKINKIIAKPWTADGSNFSSRIWKQKNQLVNELHNGLSQAFIRGTEPYDLTKQISERFKVSKGQAGRLVMTETAYFHSAAQIDAFKELGVKEYEITAVLDSRTSELCRDMDGKHLPVSEFKPGITAPPFHCWCRSTTVPYFNDEFTEEETRIARGADDKLYEIPYNMTYRQWEKKFVDGDTSDLKTYYIKGGLKKVNKRAEAMGMQDFTKTVNPDVADAMLTEKEKATEVFGDFEVKSINVLDPTVDEDGLFQGGKIYLKNISGDNALTRLRERAKTMKEAGKWSTNSPYHTLRHEYGHAIIEKLKLSDDWALKEANISDIMQSIQNKAFDEAKKISESIDEMDVKVVKKYYEKQISSYGMQDIDEFMAECIAEYLNGDKKCRTTAKKVIHILLGV